METRTPPVVGVSTIIGMMSRLAKSEKRFNNVAVRGEITNYSKAAGGHRYFDLTDGEVGFGARIWAGGGGKNLTFEPKNGDAVICYGYIDFYGRNGSYQIIVEKIEYDGESKANAELELLIKKLKSEGIFDRKRPIPAFPEKIAVITSPSGAAVKDIEDTLSKRFPIEKMYIVPCLVQGETAPQSIAAAFQRAQETDADVIIFGRGGGSDTDLSAFNSEIVARAVFNSRIPTISGVGHEVDITIADCAADRHAVTPTAAAMAAVPEKKAVEERLAALGNALSGKLERKTEQKRARLSELEENIARKMSYKFNEAKNRLEFYKIETKNSAKRKLLSAEARLEAARGRISALDPLSTLKRGFSAAEKDGKIISDVKELEVGDEVKIIFSNGSAAARITQVTRT